MSSPKTLLLGHKNLCIGNIHAQRNIIRRVEELEGQTSLLLAKRCLRGLKHWPTKDCDFEKGCPWWVHASIYHNCCFLAAQIGEHTLAEVGVMLGVTRERVRQIEQKALGKLRKNYESRHKQSLARRCRKDTSEDKKHDGEDKSDSIYRVIFGDMGITRRRTEES